MDKGSKPGVPGYSPLQHAAAEGSQTEAIKKISQKYQAPPKQMEEEKKDSQGMQMTKCTAVDGILGYFVVSPNGYESFTQSLTSQMPIFRSPHVTVLPEPEQIAGLIRLAILRQWMPHLETTVKLGYLNAVDIYLPSKVIEAINCLGNVQTPVGSFHCLHKSQTLDMLLAAVLNDTTFNANGIVPLSLYDKGMLHRKDMHIQKSIVMENGESYVLANGKVDFEKIEHNLADILKMTSVYQTISNKMRSSHNCTLFTPSRYGNTCQFVTRDGYAIYPLGDTQVYAGVSLGLTSFITEGKGYLVATTKSARDRAKDWFNQDFF